MLIALEASAPADAAAKYIMIDVNNGGAIPTGINVHGVITGYYGRGISGNGGFLRAADGTITTFDPTGSTGTNPESINAKGRIAGFYQDSNFMDHGFVRAAGGKIVSFDPPGSVATLVFGINSSGTVGGGWDDSNYHEHGFVRTADGNITSFDISGYPGTEVDAINDAGTATGTTSGGTSFLRAPDGTITTFGCGSHTYGQAINYGGTIAGYCLVSGQYRGYIRSPDGTITNFDPPGSYGTYVWGLNDKGAITGYYDDNAGVTHGFLRSAGGAIRTFDVPFGGEYPNGTFPAAINNSGSIAGNYITTGVGGFLRIREP